MELKLWQKLFVWLVFLPGLIVTLLYLGFVAWPAILFMALCVGLVKLKGGGK